MLLTPNQLNLLHKILPNISTLSIRLRCNKLWSSSNERPLVFCGGKRVNSSWVWCQLYFLSMSQSFAWRIRSISRYQSVNKDAHSSTHPILYLGLVANTIHNKWYQFTVEFTQRLKFNLRINYIFQRKQWIEQFYSLVNSFYEQKFVNFSLCFNIIFTLKHSICKIMILIPFFSVEAGKRKNRWSTFAALFWLYFY